MEFKNRLKELRIENGLLQKDIAQYLNVRNTTISAWETGDNEPDIYTLIKLAKFFKVTIDYLVGYETEDGTCATIIDEFELDQTINSKLKYKRSKK